MRAAAIALVLHGCASAGSQADAGARGDAEAAATAAAATPATTAAVPATTATAASTAPWAQKLAPLLFRDVNTLADVSMRLYRDDGTIDEGAADELARVLWASKDDEVPRVSRRLVQLVVKAAAQLDAHEVQVISSHRSNARKGSRHRTGEAIDFVFPGIAAKKLAEVLRTYAKVGVGVYVHPRSQYVHLDVREQSYHWIDGSPPGRTWREQALPDPTAAARDVAHEPAQDLP
jgi:uncharacterized protein YcbK (DUF882 family)